MLQITRHSSNEKLHKKKLSDCCFSFTLDATSHSTGRSYYQLKVLKVLKKITTGTFKTSLWSSGGIQCNRVYVFSILFSLNQEGSSFMVPFFYTFLCSRTPLIRQITSEVLPIILYRGSIHPKNVILKASGWDLKHRGFEQNIPNTVYQQLFHFNILSLQKQYLYQKLIKRGEVLDHGAQPSCIKIFVDQTSLPLLSGVGGGRGVSLWAIKSFGRNNEAAVFLFCGLATDTLSLKEYIFSFSVGFPFKDQFAVLPGQIKVIQ